MKLFMSIAGPLRAGLLALSLTAAAVQAQDLTPYLQAGLPATSRDWTGADVRDAARVLASGKVRLPMYADPAGAQVLARLVSRRQLDMYRNPSIPVGSRFQDFMLLMEGTQSILMLYVPRTGTEQTHSELASLMVGMLHHAVVGRELADEILASVPRDDHYPTRLAGLERLKRGLTQIFAGMMQSVGERNFYSDADVSLMLQGMADTLPGLKGSFTPDYLLELRSKLQGLRASLPSTTDRDNIDRMLAELG